MSWPIFQCWQSEFILLKGFWSKLWASQTRWDNNLTGNLKSFVTFADRDDRDAKKISLAMTNQRGLKEIGRRSNWIWNRTVKESRWLQEPEIGLRNAQLIIQLVQICQNFSCSSKKRAAAREGKVGKSWHKPNINWPSGSFGCTLSTFFANFAQQQKTVVAQKAQH